MGQATGKRAVAEFGWPAIAAQTADLYAELALLGLKAPSWLDFRVSPPSQLPHWNREASMRQDGRLGFPGFHGG
jgi:hypothetical protein